jgi:hypothetical protein
VRLRDLERDKDALLDHYAGLLLETLDGLAPEERNHVYKMLRLRVNMHPDRILEVSGVLGKISIFVNRNRRQNDDSKTRNTRYRPGLHSELI